MLFYSVLPMIGLGIIAGLHNCIGAVVMCAPASTSWGISALTGDSSNTGVAPPYAVGQHLETAHVYFSLEGVIGACQQLHHQCIKIGRG